MNVELLKSAQNGLMIQDIFIKECHIETGPLMATGQIEAQFRHETISHQIFETQEGEETVNLVDFHVSTALRFFLQNIEDNSTIAEVRAVFVARYIFQNNQLFDENILQEFGKHNALYHVWPYWRELAASMTSRARLPVVTLPMLFVQKNGD